MCEACEHVVRYTRLRREAVAPQRMTPGAAGYDLRSVESVVIEPGGRAVVKTGLALKISSKWYGRIAPRSGLALSNGIAIGAGVIDSDYRGEIGVLLMNTDASTRFQVRPGDRIAQILFERVDHPRLVEVQQEDQTVTERGAGGFGSTGVADGAGPSTITGE